MNYTPQRQYVTSLYPGPRWKRKVEMMPDSQISAIYLSHLRTGIKPPHVELQQMLNVPPQDPHRNEDDFHTY